MILLFLFLAGITDDIIFKTEQDLDLEQIAKDIENLLADPVDINRADVEALARIPYLSLNDIVKILEYRAERGPFESIEELTLIPGFDRTLVDVIRPFLTIGRKEVEIKKLNARARVRTELPVEEPSLEYYTKLGVWVGQCGVNAVTERDPYESSFFDHWAAGVLVDEGRRKFALGKYNLDLGGGAMLSPVGSFFQGIDFRIMLNERGLIPYTSTIENAGFFGAALSDSVFVDYTLFFSNQKLDGTIDSLGFARSLDASGEHTDSASLSRKDRINEEILGYDVRYRTADLLIASRSYVCRYEPGFATRDSVTGFFGADFFMTGVELRYFGESFVVFSEIARSWRDRFGGLFGFSAVFPFVDFNLAGKYFPAGFYSPKGTEASANHAGGTLDLKHRSAIIDAGLSLNMDNRLDEDTTKHDLKLSFAKRIGMLDARVNFRRRYRANDVDLTGSEALLRLRATRSLFFDVRFEEKTVYNEDIERGIAFSLEAVLDLRRLDARVRYGIFDTDTYGARIYVYEIDLPGVVRNRMLYNNGDYGFVYLSIRPIQRIRLSMKYAFVNRESVSEKQAGGQFDFMF
ncbi:helix-hairpin-helix domain-containing protein [candidate division WOR-3 bacterium]|nr:helix-hairpin-helix domain-containing protein [candidate division WOR-3 bacterium]